MTYNRRWFRLLRVSRADRAGAAFLMFQCGVRLGSFWVGVSSNIDEDLDLRYASLNVGRFSVVVNV